MKSRNLFGSAFSVTAAAILFCSTPALASLTMDVVPSSVYQFGTGSGVYLGHTVIAATNLNRLVAGGTFRATCASPVTGEIPGTRSMSSSLVGQRNRLSVTIPEVLPALRNMPGFANVQRGSRIECQYYWTAFAREPTYTVSIPGFSATYGGEELSDSGLRTFWMQKPGTSTGNDDACIP